MRQRDKDEIRRRIARIEDVEAKAVCELLLDEVLRLADEVDFDHPERDGRRR